MLKRTDLLHRAVSRQVDARMIYILPKLYINQLHCVSWILLVAACVYRQLRLIISQSPSADLRSRQDVLGILVNGLAATEKSIDSHTITI